MHRYFFLPYCVARLKELKENSPKIHSRHSNCFQDWSELSSERRPQEILFNTTNSTGCEFQQLIIPNFIDTVNVIYFSLTTSLFLTYFG